MEIEKYAVFGNPIEQSRSPIIHQAFAEQFGLNIDYQKILGQVGCFSDSLADFFSDPAAKGCNVTVPFKQEAAKWVTELSEAAKNAGAINTIVRKADGHFYGDTTDGLGLVLDLERQHYGFSASRVLLIGAGGAARGVILPLFDRGVAHITVVNRTKQNADDLVSWFNHPKLASSDFVSLNNQDDGHFDLIVNCTSASLYGELPGVSDAVLAKAHFAYDMVYAATPTIFVEQANKLGVNKTSDGLGMLVGQAAHSFYLWQAQMPDITPVLKQIRQQL